MGYIKIDNSMISENTNSKTIIEDITFNSGISLGNQSILISIAKMTEISL